MKSVFRLSFPAVLFVFALCGCSSNRGTNNTDKTPQRVGVSFEDFVVLDEQSNMLYRIAGAHGSLEPFLDSEAIIGEPFTDMNGNGIYDPGIDLFIRSVDSTNQDLNRNGRHDGPENIWIGNWTPDIPWDDIDGNGCLRAGPYCELPEPELSANSNYTPGVPYCDYNENGVRDNVSFIGPQLATWKVIESRGTEKTIVLNCAHHTYGFVSDSGRIYSAETFNFRDSFFLYLSDSSLAYHDWYIGFEIFSGDSIWSHSRIRDTITSGVYRYVLSREIVLDDSLSIRGTMYRQLLRVSIDSISQYNGPKTSLKYQFYFAPGSGLIAIVRPSYWFHAPQVTETYARYTGPVPLPMSREPKVGFAE